MNDPTNNVPPDPVGTSLIQSRLCFVSSILDGCDGAPFPLPSQCCALSLSLLDHYPDISVKTYLPQGPGSSSSVLLCFKMSKPHIRTCHTLGQNVPAGCYTLFQPDGLFHCIKDTPSMEVFWPCHPKTCSSCRKSVSTFLLKLYSDR